MGEIEQSPAGLSIILRIFAHVISRCDLDFWPLDLTLLRHFGCYAFKFHIKFERNRMIHARLRYWRFSTFSRAIIGHNWQSFLMCTWTQLHQTWPGHRAIIAVRSIALISEFGYHAALSNAGGSKLSDVLNDAKFSIFDPL